MYYTPNICAKPLTNFVIYYLLYERTQDLGHQNI